MIAKSYIRKKIDLYPGAPLNCLTYKKKRAAWYVYYVCPRYVLDSRFEF